MRILGAPLRGVLVPMGAAVASVLALTWYGMFWIPAQQHYLDESNLRLLRTMSAQIKARVDNFDQAIDHAIDSFPESLNDSTALNRYVQAFAPELEILKTPSKTAAANQQGAENLVYDRAGDPPRVVVQRDEGKNVLYLGYYRPEGGRAVIARADIESVAARFLATRSQFDAVLLANKDGHVITQKSPSGIELARVDSLIADFDKQRAASDIANVHLGDALFKLYLQPIQLSLNRAEAPTGHDEPEEWTLCGLVRDDHFRADSSAISYTYLLWFIVALALVFVAIPLLKLEMLAPRQRLRDVDGVWVAVTTFLGAALLTFCVTDAYVFAVAFQGATDQQLRGLADALKNHFENEVAAIDGQRNVFDGDAVWKSLKYDRDFSHYQANPPTIQKKDGDRLVTVRAEGCDPKEACEEGLLALLPRALLPYPFFERVVWYDATGQERIKWTTRKRVTPFIDLRDAQLPDSDDLFRTPSSAGAHDSSDVAAPRGIDVIQSPMTGDTVTVLWRIIKPWPSDANDRAGTRLLGQWFSLATPLSFRQPVLPPGFRFAVVDADGSVLFHSDPTRSLKQNFFEETENNPALRAAAQGRYDDLVTGNYEGRRHRFHVTPIDARVSTQARHWSLIVFQEKAVPETVNLETLTLAIFVFVVYSTILAGLWAGTYFLWAGYPQKWFWPNHSNHLAYRRSAVVNVLCLAASLVWALVFESTTLIAGTAAFAFAGLGTTFWMLTRARTREGTSGAEDARWRHSFHMARVSLVLILAVAPAFACFRAAYEFETKLLIKSGQASLARQLDARKRLIADEAEKLRFCDSDESRHMEAFTKEAFTDWRSQLALDLYVAPFFGTCRVGVEDGLFTASRPSTADHRCDHVVAERSVRDGSLDHLLAAIHRSYNDVAVDLKAAIPNPNHWSVDSRTFSRQDAQDASPVLTSDPSAATALPGPGYWFDLAVVMVVLYAFVRYVAARLFVLHLYERPAADVVDSTGAAGNVVLIGPPGCGKTDTLSALARFQLVDIREKVLDERRERARSVAAERDVVAQVAAPAPGVPWPGNAEPQRAQSRRSSQAGNWVDALFSEGKGPVAFDHFEYGFDDAVFRDHMLSALEELIYLQRREVWIASTPEPWRRVQRQPELDGNGSSLPDRDRWVGVFKWFRTVNIPFKEDKAFEEPYYQVLWGACSREEQLALRQLAEENVVNPTNESVLRPLLQDGLIVRKQTFRIVNGTFRRFILQAQSSSTIAEWEREGVVVSWETIRTTMITVAIGIGGLLLLTQQQVLEAWVGYIPMLAPAIPTAMKVLGSFQRGGKLSVSST
jgi:hypothetical protein